MPIISISLDGTEVKVEVKVSTPIAPPEPVSPPVITGE